MVNFTVLLDEVLLAKLRYLAYCDDRSVGGTVRRFVIQAVANFEQKHGPIPLERIEQWL